MPCGNTAEVRPFNYNPSSTVGVDLLSASNPENGTVLYTYNSDHTLATKTDAKGQVFSFSYDYLKRLTQVSVNSGFGNVTLRNYTYDSDPTGYSQSAQGRLTSIQYPSPIGYTDTSGLLGSIAFTN